MAGVMTLRHPWPEVRLPVYTEGRYGRWRLAKRSGSMPGYWSPNLDTTTTVVLERRANSRWTVWMSLTRMERESHQPHIAQAHGNVCVLGLGMGMYLFNILRKPGVKSVTVVDIDHNVFDLLLKASDLENWEGIEKATFKFADATQWKTDQEFDYLYADIWPKVGDHSTLPDIKKISANIHAKTYGYWTQEFDFFEWLREHKINLNEVDLQHWLDFKAELGIDLGLTDARYAMMAPIGPLVQIIPEFIRTGDRLHAMRTARVAQNMMMRALA